MLNSCFSNSIFALYRISYMWYTFLGAGTTIAVATICGLFFGHNDAAAVDATLVAPFLRRFCCTDMKRRHSAAVEATGRQTLLPPHILGDDSCAAAGDAKSRVYLSRVAPLLDESAM